MSGRRQGDSKTTADVAVTGKARPLNLTEKDRERLLDPLPLEQQNLHLPDKHN
jgi:hypothetical protein